MQRGTTCSFVVPGRNSQYGTMPAKCSWSLFAGDDSFCRWRLHYKGARVGISKELRPAIDLVPADMADEKNRVEDSTDREMPRFPFLASRPPQQSADGYCWLFSDSLKNASVYSSSNAPIVGTGHPKVMRLTGSHPLFEWQRPIASLPSDFPFRRLGRRSSHRCRR